MLRRASIGNVLAALGGLALLAGCGVLPASEPRRDPPAERARSSEPGLVAELFTRDAPELPDAVAVSTLRQATLERASGGVILRVTGVAPTQGYFTPTLAVRSEAPDAAGLLTVSFLAVPPLEPQQIGPERTRLLLAAAYASDLELRGVRGIRLAAGPNVQTLPLPPR